MESRGVGGIGHSATKGILTPDTFRVLSLIGRSGYLLPCERLAFKVSPNAVRETLNCELLKPPSSLFATL